MIRRWLPVVAIVMATVALGVSVGLVFWAVHEGTDRRDEACRGLELNHKQEVIELDRTYKFYADPPPGFEGLLKNPLVAKSLREAERAAKDDQDRYGVYVPSYCDDPGVGLKEPDPVVPARPPSLR